jgi:multidrug resistance efflux pump
MPVAFSRTLRSVEADRSRITAIGILLTGVFAGIWIGWMVRARVSVYAVSDLSRLEADGSVRQIQALQGGRIVRMQMALGQKVKAGDLLAELDTTLERMQAVETQTQGEASGDELLKVQQEIESQRASMAHEGQAATIAIQEARTRLREAETAADYAALEADRKAQLHTADLASDLEVARAKAEVDKQRAVVDGLRLAIDRQTEEQKVQTSEHQARIDGLLREASRLANERRRTGLTVHRLQREIELQRVVAPVDGRIGEIAALRVGSVITAGERLGVIVPSGRLKIVALFKPAVAVGRIRSGQLARIRFEGFPWAQYGTMPAKVSRVANELRDGYVRVDLEPLAGSRIPLQHGLPGATEIELERISPATLFLRSSGEMIKGHVQEPTEHSQPSGQLQSSLEPGSRTK